MTTMPDNVLFTQHPDDLIKKSKRNDPPEAPAALDPIVVQKEEATLEELKKKLPGLLFDSAPPRPLVTAEDAAKKEAEAKAAEAAKVAAEVAKVEEAKKVEDAKVTADAAKAAEDAKRTKARPAAAPVDPLAVAREMGKEIVEGLRKPEAAPGATADPASSLSAEDRDTYELFKVLSESEPARYKNKHEEFLAFVSKAGSYRKKWEKQNPGRAFDASDDAHEDFYTANQPQFSESDLDKARIRLESNKEISRRLDEQKKEYEKRLDDIETKTVGAEVGRQANAAADGAIGKFIGAIPDEGLRKIVSEDSEKLRETDPVAFDTLNNEATALRKEVSELHQIVNRKNYFNPDNPLHAHLARVIDSQERAIKELPVAQQRFEGRTFATRDEWASMTTEQKRVSWILAESDVVDMMTHNAAFRASKSIETERERITKMAEKYGYKKAEAAPVTPTVTPAAPAAPAGTKKQAAPAATSGGVLPTTNSPPQKIEDEGKKLVSLMF